MANITKKLLSLGAGISIESSSSSVLRKAEELCRMLDLKGSACIKSLGLIGDSKLLLCLDIAAAEAGISIDKEGAIRQSGLSKKAYKNAERVLQTLLEVKTGSSLNDCAMKIGHPELREAAAPLVLQYLDSYLNGDESLVNSRVNMAALAVVAEERKVKLKVKDLMELCGSNRSSWALTKDQMTKIYDSLHRKTESTTETITKTNKRPSATTDKENTSIQEKKPKTSNPNEPLETDSFEVWKMKILRNAKRHLKQSRE